MPSIDVKTEEDSPRGWTFQVEVGEGATTHVYHVTLSWSDYDLWSRGQVAPERVIRAAFEFLLAREPAQSILSRFDCAVIRRYFPEVDRELPGIL
jgi:hypothetical protein